METIDIYALKKVGMTNRQVKAMIDYQKKKGEDSLRNLLVASGAGDAGKFYRRLKDLDRDELEKEFNLYSSVSIEDAAYPQSLRQLKHPPVLLFYSGDLSLLEDPILFVTGNQQASDMTVYLLEEFVGLLGRHCVIANSLAMGVERAATFLNLNQGGKSIAVLGTGLNQASPQVNERLQSFMADHHLIISEYGPGTPARPHHFRERSQILLALCQGILLLEGPDQSWLLNLCEGALDLGKEIYALPARVWDKSWQGNLRLLKEGAKLVTTPEEVLFDML